MRTGCRAACGARETAKTRRRRPGRTQPPCAPANPRCAGAARTICGPTLASGESFALAEVAVAGRHRGPNAPALDDNGAVLGTDADTGDRHAAVTGGCLEPTLGPRPAGEKQLEKNAPASPLG